SSCSAVPAGRSSRAHGLHRVNPQRKGRSSNAEPATRGSCAWCHQGRTPRAQRVPRRSSFQGP
ncbi:MAG: hypothetical protein ACK56I_29220, partial [bacterium]